MAPIHRVTSARHADLGSVGIHPGLVFSHSLAFGLGASAKRPTRPCQQRAHVCLRCVARPIQTESSSPFAPEALSSYTQTDLMSASHITPQTATLLLQCPDQKGVIAAVSQLLYGFGCNVESSDQFRDAESNLFFQRITFDYSDMVIGSANTPILERGIAELARRFNMQWKIAYSNKPKRLAILVSKLDHCLYDLLIRHKSGELNCEIPVVISNHPDLQHIADMFGVPFRHLPISKAPEGKREQEANIEAVLQEFNIDCIILARYMQIFTPEFSTKHWEHTINVHHSFLPAFAGAKPYHRAHERGVKIIGATAHYATSELDAGPIIEQNITRVTHRDGVEDMIRKGRDLERLVLSKAVRWHIHDRVLVHNNKTVVFEE